MNAYRSFLRAGIFMAGVFFFLGCQKQLDTSVNRDANIESAGKGSGQGGGEKVGNNLSFPVIWSEGEKLTLRVPPAGTAVDGVKLEGAWWYVWGVDPIDPQAPIFSCQPNPNNTLTCLDGSTPGDGVSTVYKAYLQNDAGNYWQAYNAVATDVVNVDSVDWGDNLESTDWNLTSKVRTEVVLLKSLPDSVLQYSMRHVSGWGVDEMHGLQTDLENTIQYGTGRLATVYSRHARFTIQKLTADPANVTWDANLHYWTGDANAPIFNKAVYQAADGPGSYTAEVNIKGKIIYGYTWDLKKLNDGAGVYRLTFSFDNSGASTTLNTFLTGSTIIVGGSTAVVVATDNLTYIDVTIAARGGGGGQGGGHGGHN